MSNILKALLLSAVSATLFTGCVSRDPEPNYEYISIEEELSDFGSDSIDRELEDYLKYGKVVDPRYTPDKLRKEDSAYSKKKKHSRKHKNMRSKYVKRIPFPVHEYNELDIDGSGIVRGKIYVSGGGENLYGARARLYLNPITSYSRQWYEEAYLNGKKIGKADPRLYKYMKFTTTDRKGNYAFYGVADGGYYIAVQVKCPKGKYCSKKTYKVVDEVYIDNGEIVKLNLEAR